MSNPKIGQLCWFSHSYDRLQKFIGILDNIDEFSTNEAAYISDWDEWYDVCQPLTKQEIQQFMEKANEPTRL